MGAMRIFFLVPLLLALLQSAAADAILGCGGFVEGISRAVFVDPGYGAELIKYMTVVLELQLASAPLARLRKASDPKLDYSHIIVELRTLDGLVKDSTQCAPNGYYFVPVYDKGSLMVQIKGPDGWSFEPTQVTVVVDQNGCNGNEDINFHYTGFTLSGKILGGVGGQSCPGQEEGPAGVKISLTPVGSAEPSAFVTTSVGGSYKFENLLAGKYRVNAYHPHLKVESKGSPEVDLGWGNEIMDDIFYVAGYDLEGAVVSQGNPVLGVQVYLYSDDVSTVSCPQGAGSFSPLSKPALCQVVSDAEGKFIFSGVPCGKYTLIPYYKGENTLFDVSPASVEVSIGHDSVKIAKPFQVTGFSVGGRVVDSEGNGVQGVKIEIGDTERATTDPQGYYKLDQVTSTHYTIKAKKEHYKFSSLENFKVLPNMASIPEIKATHYDICGSVHAVNSALTAKRQVALTHGPASVKPQTTRTDEDGSFCFQVPPGEYRISPLTTPAENASGLLFSPPHTDISVTRPVLDAFFTQAQVSISGEVKCKSTCSPHVKITLDPVGSSKSHAGVKQATTLTDSSNMFSFEKVLPGNYKLEVRHEPLFESATWDDEWCWEEKTLEVEVGTVDRTGLVFVQKGFWMLVKSTHALSGFTLQPHKDPVPLQLQKGWQQVCLDAAGIHELHFSKPCVFFGAHSFQFDTTNPTPLDLVGQKYLLTGHVHIDAGLDPAASLLEEALLVEVRTQDGQVVALDNHARFVPEANETNAMAIYEYSHWAQLGDKLIFSPRHESSYASAQEVASTKVLYYPREQHVHVAADGCQPEIPIFHGRPGIYIKGSVVPALAGVNITIVAEKPSQAGGLMAGEVAVTAVSGSDGKYLAGPLYDDTTYASQAALEGFHLRSLGDNSFSCQKLGQIVVTINPGEGAEEVLPSVLLSLSGDDGYRKNAATILGGVFSFTYLFPGSFYLRPLLKEYSFAPSAQAIEVGSGETKEVAFTARRIAYSVLGSVTSLSGKPEEGITLEARSVSRGYYEETITDAEGKYRLRGLLPNSSYTIKVVLKVDKVGLFKIERASPESVVVEVNSSDVTDIDFVVFEELHTTIVTGVAEGAQLEKWQPNLRVEFASAADGKVERTVPVPLSYYFEVQGLPKGKYTARLVFDLSERTHKFESETIDVDLETQSATHLGPLRFAADEHYHKQELTPAPVVPVVVGVAVIAVFASMPRLKDGYQWAVSGGGGSGSLKKEAVIRKPSVRTRRTS